MNGTRGGWDEDGGYVGLNEGGQDRMQGRRGRANLFVDPRLDRHLN